MQLLTDNPDLRFLDLTGANFLPNDIELIGSSLGAGEVRIFFLFGPGEVHSLARKMVGIYFLIFRLELTRYLESDVTRDFQSEVGHGFWQVVTCDFRLH